MSTRTVERVEDWETRSFDGGYRGLHDLADQEFSGVVTRGTTRLFMLNGTVIGVLGGQIGAFEDADATAYEAPFPALPLLALMQERNDEVRAKYYTEDTPLREVDRTLSEGGFTGFVELSENVLSGDYYVVYHRGRSMSVAFIGESSRLETGEEAFERANDEVGIFEVRPADLEAIEIPEPTSEAEPDSESGSESESTTGAGASAQEPDAPEEDESDASEGADSDAPEAGVSDTSEGGEVDAPEGDATGVSESEGDIPDDEPSAEEPTADERKSEEEATPGESETNAGTSETAPERTADDTEGSETQAEVESETERESDEDSASSASSAGETEATPEDDTETRADESEDETSAREGPAERRTDEGASEADGERDEESSPTRTATEGTDAGGASDSSASEQHAAGKSPSGSKSEAPQDAPEASESSVEPTGGNDEPAPRNATGATPNEEPAGETAPSGVGSDRSGEATSEAAVRTKADEPQRTDATPDDLEIRAVPSIDPARTSTPRSVSDRGGSLSQDSTPAATSAPEYAPERPPETREDEQTTRTESKRSSATESDRPARPEEQTSTTRTERRSASREVRPTDNGTTASDESTETERQGTQAKAEPEADDRPSDLQSRLEEREQTIDDLEAKLDDLEDERDELQREYDDLQREYDDLQARVDELQEERDALQEERDDLQDRIDDLESTVETLERKLEIDEQTVTTGENSLSPQEALDGTDLFVRYESKGKATLEDAHDGDADRGDVNANLNLDYHTQFDASETDVGGEPFEQFLQETLSYRFVDWVVHNLLHEIRDTGEVAALQDLYDALPKIDRAELNGSVAVTYTEDGEQRHGENQFDVVLRDRMGDPLLVADLNDSRLAASETMMSSLITSSTEVYEANETLAAGFLVTRSFFEPEALEAADEATGSGLLSRDKRRSFVKLSRKEGFHLCLVEARNDEFYLTVPEL